MYFKILHRLIILKIFYKKIFCIFNKKIATFFIFALEKKFLNENSNSFAFYDYLVPNCFALNFAKFKT